MICRVVVVGSRAAVPPAHVFLRRSPRFYATSEDDESSTSTSSSNKIKPARPSQKDTAMPLHPTYAMIQENIPINTNVRRYQYPIWSIRGWSERLWAAVSFLPSLPYKVGFGGVAALLPGFEKYDLAFLFLQFKDAYANGDVETIGRLCGESMANRFQDVLEDRGRLEINIKLVDTQIVSAVKQQDEEGSQVIQIIMKFRVKQAIRRVMDPAAGKDPRVSLVEAEQQARRAYAEFALRSDPYDLKTRKEMRALKTKMDSIQQACNREALREKADIHALFAEPYRAPTFHAVSYDGKIDVFAKAVATQPREDEGEEGEADSDLEFYDLSKQPVMSEFVVFQIRNDPKTNFKRTPEFNLVGFLDQFGNFYPPIERASTARRIQELEDPSTKPAHLRPFEWPPERVAYTQHEEKPMLLKQQRDSTSPRQKVNVEFRYKKYLKAKEEREARLAEAKTHEGASHEELLPSEAEADAQRKQAERNAEKQRLEAQAREDEWKEKEAKEQAIEKLEKRNKEKLKRPPPNSTLPKEKAADQGPIIIQLS